MFSNYEVLEEPKSVTVGNGAHIDGVGVGTVKVQSSDGSSYSTFDIENVFHVPDIKVNLFSQGVVLDEEFRVVSNADEEKIIHSQSNKVFAVTMRDGKLFNMSFRQDEAEKALVAKQSKKSLSRYHEVFAHLPKCQSC